MTNAVPCPHCRARDGWRGPWPGNRAEWFAPKNSHLGLCACPWCRQNPSRIYVCAACGECAT
jgi:hypothetical protein